VTAGNVSFLGYIISRYNNNGTIDNTFGTNGYVNAIPDDGNGAIIGILIQPDNKIVAVGGSVINDNNGNQQGCITVVRLNPGTLSVDEFDEERIVVYPNPTKALVYFNNENGIYKTASLVNQLGQVVVKPFDCGLGDNRIDLSGLNAGVYYLKIVSSNGKEQTVKVLKQ
jgi:hypothetical protein